MQFLTSLFSGAGNTIITAVLALGIVLVLILLAVWGLKALSRASASVGRGRNRRLAVVDSLGIDPKRQLLIIRRDNVEHLILTGGTQDLLIETGIPVEQPPARLPVRRPAIVPTPVKTAAEPHAPTPFADPDKLRAPAVALDRMVAMSRPEPERRPASLRHTGLMRAVSRNEPEGSSANPDNYGKSPSDSARTSHPEAGGDERGQITSGQGKLGGVTDGEHSDKGTGEGGN